MADTPVPGRRDAVLICLPGSGKRWLAMRRALGDRYGGQVGFPAGKCEPGESQQDAVVREGLEELGVTLRPLYCFAVLPWADMTLYAWLVSAASLAFTPNPAEVNELLWLSAPELATHPDAVDALATLAAQLPTAAVQ